MAEEPDKRGAAMGTFKVSVLRCKKTGRVLFLEAGKDFVDTLLSFLLLPIGTIMHMLSTAGGQVKALERGVSGIFKSVETLDRSFLHVEKESLLQPRPAIAGASRSIGLLQGLNAAVLKHPSKYMIELPNKYYQCCNHCRSMSKTIDTTCTMCNHDACNQEIFVQDIDCLKEEVVKKLVEDLECADLVGEACSTNSGEGFVRENITYMVTDSLEVMPSTTIRCIHVLNELKVATLADLESTNIDVGVMQILQLLQAAISSSSSLNDVFAKRPEVPDEILFGRKPEVPNKCV